MAAKERKVNLRPYESWKYENQFYIIFQNGFVNELSPKLGTAIIIQHHPHRCRFFVYKYAALSTVFSVAKSMCSKPSQNGSCAQVYGFCLRYYCSTTLVGGVRCCTARCYCGRKCHWCCSCPVCYCGERFAARLAFRRILSAALYLDARYTYEELCMILLVLLLATGSFLALLYVIFNDF